MDYPAPRLEPGSRATQENRRTDNSCTVGSYGITAWHARSEPPFMHYDVHTGIYYLQNTALVYCSSWSTVQLMSLRIIICWLSLLPELIEPRSVRNVDGRLCRSLDPVRLGACPFASLRSGNASISMAFCDCEPWLHFPEALVTVKCESLLDLLLDRTLETW